MKMNVYTINLRGVKFYLHTVALCTLQHRLKYIIGSNIIATIVRPIIHVCLIGDTCVRYAEVQLGLWLPILRNSAQHLTIPHFPFSSSGSRPGWGDFNPQWDRYFITSNVQVVYLSLLCFKARQSRTSG